MKKKNRKNSMKPPDFFAMISIIILTLFGAIMVFSASAPEATLRFEDSAYFAEKHIKWVMLGLFLFFITVNIDYHVWKKCSFFIFIVSIITGLLIFSPLGMELKGAKRWIDIGVGTLMPSDVLKLGSIIFFAAFLDKKKRYIKTFKQGTIPAAIITLIPIALIYLQKDLSTAATLLGSLLCMFFVGGMHLGWLLLIPPALSGFLYYAVMSEGNEYRLKRITAFIDPFADKLGSGWQIVQSLYALSAGGIFGAGIGKSRQKYFYISESYNDFIFAIIGEEFGFIGTAFVLLLYLFLIYKGMTIAMKAKDPFGTYLATGITALLAIQSFINIGTVTSSIPATGITLPLMSFGGTSLVTYLVGLGMLMNISRQQKEKKGGDKSEIKEK